ncbi:hypothetical protein [Microbacterium sp. 77mftsu3.1]|uniref:hypothetical protein n=1 Tax=Microbacterium sp. 77mftsu3.1 TaxID=1761802 RepID=UPI000373ED1E|nr:hypothetical protein [Microbacterium sp. 77mftsu3.1]SDH33472.1 hypothetical protein SAMN04488590_3057 [Microbacterium sp. 77mftsu3.1]
MTATISPSPLRAEYLSTRPRHSFNDVADRYERLAAMTALVASETARLAEPAAWAAFAAGLAKFPTLSPANVLLVLDQHPLARRIDSHFGWGCLQRTPVERGIAILRPSVLYKRVNGLTVWDGGRPVVEEVRHRPATVFDYSQTAGAVMETPWTIAQIEPRDGFIDDMRAAAAAIGYAVESRRDEAPAQRRVFALIHGQDDRTKAMRLARDLGRAAGGEAGADLFAYALCTANGMDVPVPPLPVDPEVAAAAASSGLRRVLRRVEFRNLV